MTNFGYVYRDGVLCATAADYSSTVDERTTSDQAGSGDPRTNLPLAYVSSVAVVSLRRQAERYFWQARSRRGR
jgi:hypothetical protein